MTYCFRESSALAKLFVEEAGTVELIRMLEDFEDTHKLIAAIAPVEVCSAIRRRQRMGQLDEGLADETLRLVAFDCSRMVEQQIQGPVLEAAKSLLRQYPLRTLDAIQLAACIMAREFLRSDDIVFVCSDSALLKAAAGEGLGVFNPATAA